MRTPDTLTQVLLILSLASVLHGADMNPWHGAKKVEIPSSIDGSMQPAWFYAPSNTTSRAPLLVALHTWSADYNQETGGEYLLECQRRGWVMIHPDFRGPNRRPEACASNLAVQDVLDAVEYAKRHALVDDRRIYLVGASGGGHMAMVMAHRAPQVWAGVSAWVGISDLAVWWRESKGKHAAQNYARDIERVCGGPPGTPATDKEYRARSPIFHLGAAKGVNMDLNAGITDGHTGSVPISHTLRAFNVLADANGHPEAKLTDEQIEIMTRERKVPNPLDGERVEESGRRHKILFRRCAGPARVTIFEGGHEIDVPCALNWLAQQSK